MFASTSPPSGTTTLPEDILHQVTEGTDQALPSPEPSTVLLMRTPSAASPQSLPLPTWIAQDIWPAEANQPPPPPRAPLMWPAATSSLAPLSPPSSLLSAVSPAAAVFSSPPAATRPPEHAPSSSPPPPLPPHVAAMWPAATAPTYREGLPMWAAVPTTALTQHPHSGGPLVWSAAPAWPSSGFAWAVGNGVDLAAPAPTQPSETAVAVPATMWPEDSWTRLFENAQKPKRRYVWLTQLVGVNFASLVKHVDSQPRHATRTSQKHRCTICVFNLDSHFMAYRLLACTSPPCGNSCGALMKILTCLSTLASSVFHHGVHVEGDHTVPHRMTREMKEFIKTYTANGALPMRILGEMIPKLKLTVTSVPKLCQVQRVSGYYKKKILMETALVSQMAETARVLRYRDDLDESAPFTFATSLDAYGIPCVGNGADDRPFLIGVSTKRLMRVLAKASEYPLHIDGTHKVNQQGYPMIVVGVSDAARSIHVAAVFISSHQRQQQFGVIFSSLLELYQRVTGRQLVVKHVAGDGDDAQYNAFLDVVQTSCPRATYLMCFFHVMQKVKQRVVKMNDVERRLVFKHVYRIHFSRDDSMKIAAVSAATVAWTQTPKLLDFSAYFIREWLGTRFDGWQCYRSAIGHAKTNNPLEQFNKAFKRDYTQRRLLPLNGLMEKIKLLCKTKSTVLEEFKTKSIVTPDLPRRLKYLARAGLMSHTRVQRTSVNFILDGAQLETEILVRQHGIEKTGFPLSKTDEGRRHTLYAEVFNQPVEGWRVNVRERRCPCDWWFKFGCCVHLVEALAVFGVPMDPDAAEGEAFVSRRRNPKRRRSEHGDGSDPDSVQALPNRGGRPLAIGAALSYN